LAIELEKASIEFKREVDQTIFYEGIEVGTCGADFVIASKLIVEI
jgi:GxxExxY protein